MKYLNKTSIIQLNTNWSELFDVISDATAALSKNDFSQPIKPYLRFKNKKNRIIAMPAYIGGNVDMAGIKWIASFPDNIEREIERANSVTILNNAETGVVESIINTAEISSIRTAAVTGAFLKRLFEVKSNPTKLKIGIIGYGPIGKMHISMLRELYSNRPIEIHVCDINYKVGIEKESDIEFHNSYDDFFETSDIIITATNSSQPYIDKTPKKGSIHLNISLRDYKDSFFKNIDKLFVDNWEEACRENTDIERVHFSLGIQKSDTLDIIDLFNKTSPIEITDTDTVSFNPMGMAIFDIAVAFYFYKKALVENIGENLAD